MLKQDDLTYGDIGTIVAAACLAHDIGNPPFGHSGEKAIQQWARTKFRGTTSGELNLNDLIPDRSQQGDFLSFEGNAQSFRIHSKLQARERRGGLRLTLATIGAMTKYPRPSLIEEALKDKDVSLKKCGYFQDDAPLAVEAFRGLGLIEKSSGVFQRHPLAFLVEAADDICYAIIDIEDAHQLRIIPYSDVEDVLLPIAKRVNESPINSYNLEATKISRLRAMAIHALTMECIQVFKENLKQIENDNFKVSLISQTSLCNEYEKLKTLANKVYINERVLQIEYAGFQAIGGLIEMYYSAILTDQPDPKEKNLRQLFPRQHLQLSEQQFNTHDEYLKILSPYQRLLVVTDYISGMTDTYAVDLYQKLSGIKLPS
ncbi:dGTP triphosphohydrolase [Candidatus Brocadia sinica JPN1]|uniref:dGTP triphosphohydrolase n=1 Tax=Candidatus Brocadia sinica JPN1 TaxID=1197129 RepID=A0ABQ0K3R4_9BACT|nr:dNTP triphosphohydrolase [Candidatus Jettenia sp. AMX1]GAN35337.1 dGTP triphosphohydrolase [Candidatus Brocadia sinica JPN1]GIK12331.1 MAG: dehydrogenase [Candidatus Brocadia sinica]